MTHKIETYGVAAMISREIGEACDKFMYIRCLFCIGKVNKVVKNPNFSTAYFLFFEKIKRLNLFLFFVLFFNISLLNTKL